jgi:hypothetical protein
MELAIDMRGQVRCVYNEAIDLAALGKLSIRRASYVEPDAQGCWTADMAQLEGPKLGVFVRRSEAVKAEQEWLEKNWLTS